MEIRPAKGKEWQPAFKYFLSSGSFPEKTDKSEFFVAIGALLNIFVHGNSSA
jgi:hypothetical protein